MGDYMDQYENFIHVSRYARWDDSQGRRETWDETVDRYVNFMCDSQLPGKIPDNVRKEIREAIVNKEVMPSMRCLMTAGEALSRDNAAAFNCSALAIDCPEAFDEAMYLLMVGSGVGFSVERQFINKLPEVAPRFTKSPTIIKVEDSRIGWVNALRELIGMLYSGRIPSWDVSEVRPEGSRLKVFGGRASGPRPLVELFEFAIRIFTGASGRKLNSLECHDIMCKIAEVVISGSIRRSATISLSNPSDDRMRYAKSGSWYDTTPWRALANNSAVYTERPSMDVWFREWQALMESKAGERGVVNREAIIKHLNKLGRRETEGHDFLVNPCVTDDTMILVAEDDKDGKRVHLHKKVGELIGVPFFAVVNGHEYRSEGFFYTGDKEVYRTTMETIYVNDKVSTYIDSTLDHPVATYNPEGTVEDVAVGDLTPDHRVVVNDCTHILFKDDPVIKSTLTTTFKQREYIGIKPVYDCTVDGIHYFSANGIIVHNCGEIALRPCQQCNLSEVIVRSGDTLDDLKRKIRVAAILGTMQATLTDFAHLRPIWKNNAEEEALLGVSLSGIMDNSLLSGKEGREPLKDALKVLKDYAIEVNKEWAEIIGVNQATAVTTVKPSGCRPASAITVTNKGILTLDELMENHPEGGKWGEVPKAIYAIDSDRSSMKITRTYDNGMDKTYRIQLSHGMDLTSTKDHKWWLAGTKSIPGWYRAEEIQRGEVIEVDYSGVYSGCCMLQDYRHTYNVGACLKVDPNSTITKNGVVDYTIAWLLGYLYGVGYLRGSDGTGTIISRNKYEADLLRVSLSNFYSSNLAIDYDPSKSITTFNFDTDSLNKWLVLNNCIYEDPKDQYKIPRPIRESGPVIIRTFMAGLLDSRGSLVEVRDTLPNRKIVIPSNSYEESDHIQHVGWSVGLAFNRDRKWYTLGLSHYTNPESLSDMLRMSAMVKNYVNGIGAPITYNPIVTTGDMVEPGTVIDIIDNGDMPTYDIETDTHYFYAGAVKSHNTVSQLVGCSSGLHPRFSNYYIRTVRQGVHDPVSKLLIDSGIPHEVDIYNSNQYVFSFPIKSPEGAALVKDIPAIKQLNLWKMYRLHWCEHQPSITVYVKEEEWMEVGAWVYANFDIVGGLSFLPVSDHVYQQAPYQEITEERYNELISDFPEVDWDKLKDYEQSDDAVTATREFACTANGCDIV